jgi:biofilm PGA synthesis N-glycosyltransferase PgaC
MDWYLFIVKLTIVSCYSNILNTFVLYPLFLLILSRVINRKPKRSDEFTPDISILISAYNEENLIEDCIRSVYNSNYPNEKIRVLVGSDGSSDRTEEIVEGLTDEYPALELFKFPRQGKNKTVNSLVEQTKTDIIFFMDADIRLDENSIKVLISHFNDPKIGAVISSLKYIDKSGNDNAGRLGESLYQKYESFIRLWESKTGSTVNSLGAFYSVRKELISPIPNDFVADDMIPIYQILQKRKRVIYTKESVVFEEREKSLDDEISRRVRSAASGMSTLWETKNLLLPHYGLVSNSLTWHKLMRWLTPIYLLGILIGSFMLPPGDEFRWWMLLIQGVLYGSALLGWIFEKIGFNFIPFKIAIYFVTMNYGFMLAWFHAIGRKKNAIWSRDISE